jgi:hypothetical protein
MLIILPIITNEEISKIKGRLKIIDEGSTTIPKEKKKTETKNTLVFSIDSLIFGEMEEITLPAINAPREEESPSLFVSQRKRERKPTASISIFSSFFGKYAEISLEIFKTKQLLKKE